jgi:hypothetical protein
VSETAHQALAGYPLQARQVSSTSVSNEGYFTLKAYLGFPHYLPSHCSGVRETSHDALPSHLLEGMQVWSISVSNEGYWTLET